MLCRLVEGSARAYGLPIGFLTRLMWQESGFRTAVTSPAGALGIAQFMPQTAAERGLADPFDPEQAISHAAELLAELSREFGNLGLAAAAYNAGAFRVGRWLQAQADLPAETRAYVLAVTARSAEQWAALRGAAAEPSGSADRESCIVLTADLRGASMRPLDPAWQARIDGNLSNAVALMSAFSRNRPGAASAAADRDVRAAADFCASTRAMGLSCAVMGR
ncbi:MAG: lytic transglycosylase domain-containing protein [Alphaproteobacteria bacterium]|nr:lytic transglycosylase domain-containing protein [Alphaproteobacteria bacterium]